MFSKNDRPVDCIIHDNESIRPEVQEFFKSRNTKQIYKSNECSDDLNKCLYLSLEKISENYQECLNKKQYSVIILQAGTGNLDTTLNTFSSILQYFKNYPTQLFSTEIFLMSKSSIMTFLKSDLNIITPSLKWINHDDGYSIIPLHDTINTKVKEFNEDKEIYSTSRELKFGQSILFRKRFKGDKIRINIEGELNGLVLFTFTTNFHNKD